uniref:Uncharacterized protein n=1 Tax=Arcella intermedia TaxID=1963864 RepID=A0A6B2LGM8_9EUKA
MGLHVGSPHLLHDGPHVLVVLGEGAYLEHEVEDDGVRLEAPVLHALVEVHGVLVPVLLGEAEDDVCVDVESGGQAVLEHFVQVLLAILRTLIHTSQPNHLHKGPLIPNNPRPTNLLKDPPRRPHIILLRVHVQDRIIHHHRGLLPLPAHLLQRPLRVPGVPKVAVHAQDAPVGDVLRLDPPLVHLCEDAEGLVVVVGLYGSVDLVA